MILWLSEGFKKLCKNNQGGFVKKMPTSNPDKLSEKWRRNKATQRARQNQEPQEEEHNMMDATYW